MKFLRHGDVNLHEVEGLPGGETVEHDGTFILARGEATGSVHLLSVGTIGDLTIKRDADGRMYFQLLSAGTVTHTHDHETITLPPGTYTQVQEREVDHFADSVVRKVLD